MAKKKRRNVQNSIAPQKRSYAFLNSNDFMDMIHCGDYVSLADNPEILTACKLVADLVSNMTIYLMSNTDKGDIRIKNELSRHIDISPNRYMTRKTLISSIVMNLLLYGRGNSIVYPKFEGKLLGDLIPVPASRIGFLQDGWGYKVLLDGVEHDPNDFMHFVWNPDSEYPWRGKGITVAIRDVAKNLKQAAATENGFMTSKWKPSLIVKVEAIGDEFSDPAKRRLILDDFVSTSEAGEPWLLPADQFSVEQIRPLSLNDLALKDTVELDKRTVASLIGIPAFMLGVGAFNSKEWDNFINTTILSICKIIEQEMTRKLIISEKWYWKMNITSLYAFDLKTASSVYGDWYKSGLVTGNEARDKISMPPIDGLDELVILENYIPVSSVGLQKKLKENDDENNT